ncbi:MAG: hypothetical protein LUQ50_05195, partial [Methanospirillum sp.]|uniref:hypothetical protein n=1 Tax=Methanospirillum sp. TaxID=45200 RepID=UPI002373CC19
PRADEPSPKTIQRRRNAETGFIVIIWDSYRNTDEIIIYVTIRENYHYPVVSNETGGIPVSLS